MADQYTRIVTGGSPLDAREPVVGLLFGVYNADTDNSENGYWMKVTDADDVPVNRSDAASTQISLHQAVFAQHSVVGWYRVSDMDHSPTPEDLILSQQLALHYQQQSRLQSKPQPEFLFALLHVKTGQLPHQFETKNDEEDGGELPLSLFYVHLQQQVLIGLEEDEWKLETAVSEQIAVERVLQEQPPQPPPKDSGNGTDATMTTTTTIRRSPLIVATSSLQQSMGAIQERMTVLEQFLQDTANGTIPYDCTLLRQIQGLLLHAGALNSTMSSRNDSAMVFRSKAETLLQQLSVLAKTVTTVQQYTDKARAVHESNAGHHHTSSKGRGMFSTIFPK